MTAIVDKDSGGSETQRVEFTYDVLNRRISKTVGTEVTHFVYNGENVLLDFVDYTSVKLSASAFAAGFMYGWSTPLCKGETSTMGSCLQLNSIA